MKFSPNAPSLPNIPTAVKEKWQNIVSLISELINVPATLIMRIVESDITVFASNHNKHNPYHIGEKEHLSGSGLYCETVIKTKSRLLVPNALNDEKWKNNPDVKHNMISYLGYPVLYPDGTPFGTICVLDNKENHFSETVEQLIINFREIVQNHLELIYMNSLLGDENRKLADYLNEIKVLRGLLPICTYCKKNRDNEGDWHSMEVFISKHSDAEFSHGICEDCLQKLYPDL